MKTKLFILCIALVASIGSSFADFLVTVGDLRYLLNEETKTAKVTYKFSVTVSNGDTYYNTKYKTNPPYATYTHWDIDTANIPATIEYYGEIYDVTGIGEHAFEQCDSLRSITIPSSVTSIEYRAFKSCKNLTAVHITDIDAWCAIEFRAPNGQYEVNNPLSVAHNLYLNGNLVTDLRTPDNMTRIREYAFEGCHCLTSIIVSDSVTHIENQAFYNCPNLKTAVIGKNVTDISKMAFNGSTYLKRVTINSDSIVSRTYTNKYPSRLLIVTLFGDSVAEYIIGEGVTKIGNWAFADSPCLQSVVIPNSVTRFGEHCFRGCYYLTSINIPNSVTVIDPWAFNLCKRLTSLTIPNSVTSIGEAAFAASGLSAVEIPNSITSIAAQAFGNCGNLSSVTIPNSVTSIGKNAFSDCISLTSIHIPNSVTSIGEEAFSFCKGLTSIVIPNSVTNIDNRAFYECSQLKAITLSNSLTKIADGLFIWCSKLDSVKIPYSIDSIGERAFENCRELKSIDIPDSLKSINKKAFRFCRSLASIELPDGLEIIGDSCFLECEKLTSITVPDKVKSIGFLAFNAAKEIILLPLTPPVITAPKYSQRHYCNYNGVPVYVPCGKLEEYMATEWSIHNLQYQPNIFEIRALSNDTLRGNVVVENNSCQTLISASPYEGNYFVQWSDGNTDNPRTITLTQDTTITAIFATQTFTVTFVDDNDTILSTQEYEYGAMPLLPADPVKTNDAQYSYTFAGWSPQIVTVTSDATYKATYTSMLNKYTITFMNGDSILSADLWEYGKIPIYRGEVPTKAEDDKYTYAFNGWSPEIVSVVADATYSAIYTANEKTEAVDNILDKSIVPAKIVDKGTIYILMPNGKKYSIIGELIK